MRRLNLIPRPKNWIKRDSFRCAIRIGSGNFLRERGSPTFGRAPARQVIHCLLQLGNFAVPITTNNTQSLIQPAILRRSALSRSGENAAKRPPRLDMTGGFRPAGPLIVAAATDSDV